MEKIEFEYNNGSTRILKRKEAELLEKMKLGFIVIQKQVEQKPIEQKPKRKKQDEA